MTSFQPKKILYEKEIFSYPQGEYLFNKFKKIDNCEFEEIKYHNRIPSLNRGSQMDYIHNKKVVVLGVRKSCNLIPNSLSANYIVPFTSSGCPAMCLYCYLVCNLKSTSNLRIFVNRDDFLKSIIAKSKSFNTPLVYELGCNSDLVLENTMTENLHWIIPEIGKLDKCTATFATKYHMIDSILPLPHKGNVQIRLSMNPQVIISKIELGTSSLDDRIWAANELYHAGYDVGINLAPIIFTPQWKRIYIKLFSKLRSSLCDGLRKNLFFEIIFMTYSRANDDINKSLFKYSSEFFDLNKMTVKKDSKLQYSYSYKKEGSDFFKRLIKNYFPFARIKYIV